MSLDNIGRLKKLFGLYEFRLKTDSDMMRGRSDSNKSLRDVRYLVALMTSNRKIESNRRNAAASTGPKTARGKSLSRFNALQFGAFSDQPLIRGENADEHSELIQNLTRELAPQSVVESMLVDQIIGDMWRLKRLEKAEQAYFEKMRESLFSRLLRSLSDRELDFAIPLIEDEDSAREATANRNYRENELDSNIIVDEIVDSIPEEMDVRQEQAVKRALKKRIEDADNLGSVFLEGLAAPQKDVPYTHLDRLRRSLVRDILQKYEALALLQRDRRTIDGASKSAD